MSDSTIEYFRTAERPGVSLWISDDDGSLINFAAGYTFVWKIGTIGSAALFTKSSGITGAAGSGTPGSGTPNVAITFTAGELDSLAAGYYTWQLRATTSSVDRIAQGAFVLTDVIT